MFVMEKDENTIKTIHTNGMKSRNSWKIVEMNHQGDNILGF